MATGTLSLLLKPMKRMRIKPQSAWNQTADRAWVMTCSVLRTPRLFPRTSRDYFRAKLGLPLKSRIPRLSCTTGLVVGALAWFRSSEGTHTSSEVCSFPLQWSFLCYACLWLLEFFLQRGQETCIAWWLRPQCLRTPPVSGIKRWWFRHLIKWIYNKYHYYSLQHIYIWKNFFLFEIFIIYFFSSSY